VSSLHQRAKDLFIEALSLPAERRGSFVSDACAGDPALRNEVESLLAFHEEDREASVAGAASGTRHSSPSSDLPPPDFFAPGMVFASRYRMVTRIGRGGMGDVWRADDLVLETPVALKLIFSTDPDARGRILNEVRLARRITHPAVCRVFDFGEADGRVFFTMELVRGEDLATLIKRVGRLPSEKVIDIARQLCAGLGAAHAQGVLHRDLKPANVLIDDEGRVRITDFGIAITRSESGHHTLIGTPGYMAPEQLEPGARLSERTDIYALGLVLYELVTGRHPFQRAETAGPPVRPALLVPDVNPQLEEAILKALSRDPRSRPGSAGAMTSGLPRAFGGRRRPRMLQPAWIAAAAGAALVTVLAFATPMFWANGVGVGALTEQDTIVLADFVNSTGDPVFDGTLKVALAVALEQTPFLKVFPDQRVQETLRLMQREPDERITRPIAREIARREHLKALIAGSIGNLGSNYVLALEAINADSGDVMAREQVEAAGKEQVLTELGKAAARLREKLGESLASIQRFDVPLARATTSSLEALQAYSLALDEGRFIPRPEAIPHLTRAIELDPNFALAQALMSGVLNNTGRTSEAPVFSRRAFELRDRVSERERYFISWRYYLDATMAWDKALQLSRSWTTTYPREVFAFNSLGIAAAAFGEHEEGIKALREAIRIDPKFTIAYGNLAGSLIAVNRFDEARTALADAAARGVNFISLSRMVYLLAFLDHDAAAMALELKKAQQTPEGVWSSNWEARTFLFEGRIQAAHHGFHGAVESVLESNGREYAGQWTMEDAEAHAIVGQCAEARREVTAGLNISRDNFTLERASRVLALCNASADAETLMSELARRFPEAALTHRILMPITTAALALARGEGARTLAILEAVKPYDDAPSAEFWPSYLRGQAYLETKDGKAAAAEFERIVSRRGKAPTSPLYPLAYLGLGRAFALNGDVEQSRRAYQEFLALWQQADASLPPLAEARQESARLQ
jgi:eukaryotic-like serine/threonine-protein kinase